jgi:hypothetical protein
VFAGVCPCKGPNVYVRGLQTPGLRVRDRRKQLKARPSRSVRLRGGLGEATLRAGLAERPEVIRKGDYADAGEAGPAPRFASGRASRSAMKPSKLTA